MRCEMDVYYVTVSLFFLNQILYYWRSSDAFGAPLELIFEHIFKKRKYYKLILKNRNF